LGPALNYTYSRPWFGFGFFQMSSTEASSVANENVPNHSAAVAAVQAAQTRVVSESGLSTSRSIQPLAGGDRL
jgi:hypothetical protein